MKIASQIQRRLLLWDRKASLTKRQQFVLVTVILVFGLMLTEVVPPELRYPMTAVLSLVTYWMTAFALRENLRGIKWVTLLLLPTLFTLSISLFYFLLPTRWLTRVPFLALYAVGMYALMLTENIYHVASERTIALLRAAHSVGYLITLTTYFLLVQTVLAFRFPGITNTILVGVISFFLVFQSLWSVVLEETVSKRVWAVTVAVSLVLTELAWLFSYLPTQSTLIVLFVMTSFYGMVGMAQQYLVEKLYKKTVVEFFSLTSIVFIITMIATHWRGNF
ncbi:MAG TPA: hypothetical protein VMR81_00450 [Patescibacteria group bacterium]|jgi:hypothetical protein|nr:hypothetical protein [Patescibacteria group bacterium]